MGLRGSAPSRGPAEPICGAPSTSPAPKVPASTWRRRASWPRPDASRCAFDGEDLGYEGVALLAGSVRGDEFYGWTSLPNGADPVVPGTRTEAYEGAARGTVAMEVPEIDLPFIRPMMEYGRSAIPSSPPPWSCGTPPCGPRVPRGAWRTPTCWCRPEGGGGRGQSRRPRRSGGDRRHRQARDARTHRPPHPLRGQRVNESGFAIVPEVQMGDVVTHNNIWMYRQLAGGLTTAHIKHGSANPIGGENVFVKMRWGSLARGPQVGKRTPDGEVRPGREPQAAPGALPGHPHGDAGDHPRPLLGRP